MAAAFPGPTQIDRALASRPPNAVTLPAGNQNFPPVIANARFYRAEDYHQKYYLRHDRTLMAELASYSPQAFVDSTVAARLNAYCAGHGSIALLEAELDAMCLSRGAVEHLRARLGKRRA